MSSVSEVFKRSTLAWSASAGRFLPRLPTRGTLAPELVFDRGAAFPAGVGIDPGVIARAIARLDPETRARFTEQSDAAERGIVTLLGYDPL